MFINIQIKKIIFTVIFLCGFAFISHGFSENQPPSSKHLRKLSTKITRLQKTLRIDKSKQSNLQKKLRQSEKKISDSNIMLDALAKQIKRQESILTTLTSQHANTQKRLEKQQIMLAKQLKNAYINSRQDPFISLLNQREPADIGRYLILYHYINKQHIDYIHALKDDLDNLAKDSQAIKETQKQLASTRIAQIQINEELEQQLSKRKQLLAQIKRQIRQQNTQLSTLRKEKKLLEQVLSNIEKSSKSSKPNKRHRLALH